eukprot:1208611-Rhodomonas_salina.5
MFPPNAFPPPNFAVHQGYGMGCAPSPFPMQYPAHAAPRASAPAPLPSPAPPKRKHVRKKRDGVPPPVHATHEVAASASHADTSEAWLRIPEQHDPSTEDADLPFADDSLAGDGDAPADAPTSGRATGYKFTAVEDDVLVEVRCRHESALMSCKNNPNTLVWKTIAHKFNNDARAVASRTSDAADKTVDNLQSRWQYIWGLYCKWHRELWKIEHELSGTPADVSSLPLPVAARTEAGPRDGSIKSSACCDLVECKWRETSGTGD